MTGVTPHTHFVFKMCLQLQGVKRKHFSRESKSGMRLVVSLNQLLSALGQCNTAGWELIWSPPWQFMLFCCFFAANWLLAPDVLADGVLLCLHKAWETTAAVCQSRWKVLRRSERRWDRERMIISNIFSCAFWLMRTGNLRKPKLGKLVVLTWRGYSAFFWNRVTALNGK